MRVFISYRREDSSGQAGRLYDALSKQLGPENVFMDVDTIDIGVEFKEAIESAVGSCDVLFAMIGPRWLTVVDSSGERRLEREDDFVRLEIETALMRNIRVVPALVGGALMPEPEDLPESLAPLARRNALEMADGPRWGYDVSRLVNLLDRIRAGESQSEAAAHAAMAGATEAASAPLPGDVTSAPAPPPPVSAPIPVPEPSVAATPTPPAGGHGGWDGGSAGHGPGGHGGGGRKSGGLSDAPRWLVALAGLGIVAVIALALVAAYQLGKDEPSSNANAGSTTPGTVANAAGTTGAGTTADRADVPAGADADQAALWLAIPKTIRRQACHFANTEHAGGVATINCDFNDPKHGRTLVHLDRFIDDAHLNPIYRLHGPGRGAGAWRESRPEAEEGHRRLRPDAVARRRAVEPRDERRRHGTRERPVCLLPVAGAVRSRQEDGADRRHRHDVLRDRLDGSRRPHVRQGRAAVERARGNRVLLRLLASPVRLTLT